MQLTIEALREEVSRAQTVQSSAAVMLNKLTSELQSISNELATKVGNAEVDTAPLNDLIAQLKASTSSLATAVADSSNAITVKEVILHAEDPTQPTVQVIMPEVLPENVVVTVEQIVETVDLASEEPQVVVTVEASPEETAPEPETVTVMETPEGEVDVNVEVPAEATAVAEEVGVNVIEAVIEAVAEAEVHAEPAVEAVAEEVVAAPEPAPGA